MTPDFTSVSSMLILSTGTEENYTNSSCVVASFTYSNDSILPPAARVIQTLYGLCLVLLGVPLNALVLFLVAKYKKLRTVSFAIAVQLAVVNLVSSISYGLLTVANNAAGYQALGINYCTASGFILHTLFTLRTLLIFIFSLNRFLSVFLPFFYPKHNRKMVITMSVLAHTLSVIFNTINLPGILDCFIYVEDALLCVIGPTCHSHCKVLLYVFFSTTIIPAVIVPVGLFSALCAKSRQIRSQDRAMGVSNSILTEQKWRAIKTFFILFVAILVAITLPFLILYMAKLFEGVTRVLLKLLAVDILLLLVFTDPIIILKNGDVKQVLKIGYIVNFFKSYFKRKTRLGAHPYSNRETTPAE